MLSHITIKDFAIVDQLELDLNAGLTVLTGETGAGKSILIDALGLVLGDRAEAGFVRHGCERADITASFEINDRYAASQWLKERELDQDGECILRRAISKDGRSKGFINGQPMPIQALKELGEMLVDIHGQHEHQSLMKTDVQRQTLDAQTGLHELLRKVSQQYQSWQILRRELDSLSKAKAERDAKLELLQFQVQELKALELKEDELSELNQEHARLANASRLLETAEQALYLLYENDDSALISVLGHISGNLEQLQQVDNRLTPAVELINNASIQINEAVTELRHYRDTTELDPQRLEWVEQRIAAIQHLARKHHVGPEELIKLLSKIEQELEMLLNADVRFEHVQKEISDVEKTYRDLAKKLSAGRKKASAELAKQITANMRQLGMQGGRFDILVEPLKDDSFTANGMDRIEFLVSANPGQPLKPLAKVASGGELSRISLAIQVITAQSGGIPSLIFDEVDTGVGGGVAEMVGHKLHTLGKHHQVICVTHLPQVAALGHHHLQVNKQTNGESTRTQIQPLSADERVDEIARMLGGIEVTTHTLNHAREMVERASRL